MKGTCERDIIESYTEHHTHARAIIRPLHRRLVNRGDSERLLQRVLKKTITKEQEEEKEDADCGGKQKIVIFGHSAALSA